MMVGRSFPLPVEANELPAVDVLYTHMTRQTLRQQAAPAKQPGRHTNVKRSDCAVQTLCQHCTKIVLTMYQHCINIVPTLYQHCSSNVPTLPTLHQHCQHCTNTANIAPTLPTLHQHCTNNVPILY